MNLISYWIKYNIEQDRKKQIAEALKDTSTPELTAMWDDWGGTSNMFPGEAPVSELDIYCELRKRGIYRVYC